MKKITCLFFVLILLLSSSASFANSTHKGITIEDFLARFEDVPMNLPSATSEYDNRTLFVVFVAESSSAFYGATFRNSDILEFATGTSEDNTLMVYFFAAASEGEDTQMRIDLISDAINNVDVVGLLSNKWSKSKDSMVGEYYLEGYISQETTRFTLLNSASKIKDKDAMATLFPQDAFPINEIVRKSVGLDSENTPSSQPSANGITLSSGEYDCPAHIPAGEYKVSASRISNLFVYRNGSLKTNEILDPDVGAEIGRLVLQDGDTLEISGNLTFEPF